MNELSSYGTSLVLANTWRTSHSTGVQVVRRLKSFQTRNWRLAGEGRLSMCAYIYIYVAGEGTGWWQSSRLLGMPPSLVSLLGCGPLCYIHTSSKWVLKHRHQLPRDAMVSFLGDL